MMQIQSSNYRSSRRSNHKAPLMARWFDGIVDKACSCAPVTGYNVGDEVYDDDDCSMTFDECDFRQQQVYDSNSNSKRSQKQYPDFITSRPHRSRDDSSVLWRAADESIQWLVENKQIKSSYRREFEEVRKPKHDDHDQRHGPPMLPASDATATTVQTGITSKSSQSTARPGGRSSKRIPQSPAATCSRRAAPPAQQAIKERAHSTGTMRRPEDQMMLDNEEDQVRIQHANSIHSPLSSFSSGAVRCRPREVWVLRRISSETLPKLPSKKLME